MYRWSKAENFGSVRLMVREKISSQTDGQGEYISVFLPMKKALKIMNVSSILYNCLNPEIVGYVGIVAPKEIGRETDRLHNRLFSFRGKYC